jgi:thiamine monophosphate kinase
VADVAAQLDADPAAFAATAGEDHELCACIPASARGAVEEGWPEAGGATLTWIGRVLSVSTNPGLEFAGVVGELSGYEHSP